MQVLSDMASLEKSALFLRVHPERGFGRRRVINVWWKGGGNNAELMLILSHLIRMHSDWDDAELRLSRIVDSEEGTADTRRHMETMLEEVHVDGTVKVIVRRRDRPFVDIMEEHSQDVDLTVLGMQLPEGDAVQTYGERLDELCGAFGSVLMVHNARTERGLLETA